MKVIVAGGSGFVGKNFIKLAQKNWEIHAIYNTSKDFPNWCKQFKNVKAWQCDLLDEEQAKKIAHKIGDYDVCLFTVANTLPLEAESNPTKDLQLNVFTLMNFLKQFSGKRFIFFSTGTVYLGQKGKANDNGPFNSTSPYAISKLTAESYVKFYSKKGKISSYFIVRWMGAYGPYEPERKPFTQMIRAFKERKENKFTIYGDGKNLIDRMHIDDTIRAIMLMIKAKKANTTFQLCDKRGMTVLESVKRAAKTFGIKNLKIEKKGTVTLKSEYWPDPLQQKKAIGFIPKIKYEEGMKRFAKFLENQK